MNPDAHLLGHYTLLTYPFEHSIEGGERGTRLEKLVGRWHHAWSRYAPQDVERSLDDTYFFLPHIRTLLFPETTLLPEGTATAQLPKALEIARTPFHEIATRLPSASVLRMTYAPHQLEALHPLRLEFASPDAPPTAPLEFAEGVRINWVDVHLFPQGIGLLTMRVELESEAATVASLADFLYYLRLVHPLKVGWQLADWRCTAPAASSVGGAGEELTFKTRDLIDYLLQGLTKPHKQNVQATEGVTDARLEDFVVRLRQGGNVQRYSDTSWGQGYGAILRQYTYACLDDEPNKLQVEGSAEGVAAGKTPALAAAHEGDRGPSTQPLPGAAQAQPAAVAISTASGGRLAGTRLFESDSQQVLYEIATSSLTSHPMYRPHRRGVASIMRKGYIAIWSNWQGLALHDNVVFLGTSRSRFTLRDLPGNVQGDYFNVYLLTLYQKMRLSHFSGELIRPGDDLKRNLREARELWEAFTMFRNHYWFAEVTFRPQGNELYRRFSSGLGVQELFKHTEQEMQVLGEFYERKASRRVERLLDLLAFFVVPAEIIVHFFAHTVVHEADWWLVSFWTAIAYMLAYAVWRAWNRWGPE